MSLSLSWKTLTPAHEGWRNFGIHHHRGTCEIVVVQVQVLQAAVCGPSTWYTACTTPTRGHGVATRHPAKRAKDCPRTMSDTIWIAEKSLLSIYAMAVFLAMHQIVDNEAGEPLDVANPGVELALYVTTFLSSTTAYTFKHTCECIVVDEK